MGTKGQTINSQIFKKQSMKNKEQMQGVIRAAGNGMQRGSSYGADSMGTPRYANGGSYDPKGPTRMGMGGNYENPGGESTEEEKSNLLMKNPIATEASGGSSYKFGGDVTNPNKFTGGLNTSLNSYLSGQIDSAKSSGGFGDVNAAVKGARSASRSLYNQGGQKMDAGADALDAARNLTTGVGGVTSGERRTAIKGARATIKEGRKIKQSGNRSTKIRGDGFRGRVNNRQANAELSGGTAAGNFLRSITGKKKKGQSKQI
jgi:hypothetical protein|tara:strand:+ start:757 stop:1536 length:780 start_codon:yes stop_codon:yes gene_type:complete